MKDALAPNTIFTNLQPSVTRGDKTQVYMFYKVLFFNASCSKFRLTKTRNKFFFSVVSFSYLK